MSKPENIAAFPLPETERSYYQPGMSLRDYFAGQAITGILANSETDDTARGFAKQAYDIANAMLSEREYML